MILSAAVRGYFRHYTGGAPRAWPLTLFPGGWLQGDLQILNLKLLNSPYFCRSKFCMATKFSKETYLYWYETMLLQRRFEEKAGQLYGMQKIRGFCHLYIGQEAVSAGMMTAIRDEDNVITAYRDHGLAIAKGISAKECMAELYGKATGCTKGKGGSMHFFLKKNAFLAGMVLLAGK